MKKIFKISTILLFSLLLLSQPFSGKAQSIEEKAAQLLIIGFRGTELNSKMPIYKDITQRKIGGVILFDYDAPSKSRPRNVTSPKQLTKLCNDLQLAGKGQLFISVDQEGGKVDRLKPRYGFPTNVSAAYLGKLNNADSTAFWASKSAKLLAQCGFNVNFAPCVDLNINPQCPVIGKVDRSFSALPDVVVKHASIFIEEQDKQNIISALKHFPGHGSSANDTHLGISDITDTWSETELIPYRQLIDSNKVEMIMTSHVYNGRLDTLPATLSKKIITGILREQLGFKGVIVSDDMAMGAIVEHYSFEDAIEKSLNAGVDMLILSNNGKTYDAGIAQKAITVIVKLVEEGKIPSSVIDLAYQRVMQLKAKHLKQ